MSREEITAAINDGQAKRAEAQNRAAAADLLAAREVARLRQDSGYLRQAPLIELLRELERRDERFLLVIQRAAGRENTIVLTGTMEELKVSFNIFAMSVNIGLADVCTLNEFESIYS